MLHMSGYFFPEMTDGDIRYIRDCPAASWSIELKIATRLLI